MSRLEIKTTSPELPRLPRLLANTSQGHVTLSSTATALPDIQLQTPSAEKRRAHHVRVPSSPPPYLEIANQSASPTKGTDKTRGGESGDCTTPILPRQRQGMLHPPSLGSPIWNEVTSSVVKSRAANGLLNLRRQQD